MNNSKKTLWCDVWGPEAQLLMWMLVNGYYHFFFLISAYVASQFLKLGIFNFGFILCSTFIPCRFQLSAIFIHFSILPPFLPMNLLHQLFNLTCFSALLVLVSSLCSLFYPNELFWLGSSKFCHTLGKKKYLLCPTKLVLCPLPPMLCCLIIINFTQKLMLYPP